MTLQERLKDYKERKSLSIAKTSRMTGISETHVSNMVNNKSKNVTGATIKKLVDNLGPEFEEYLEYKTCTCGKEFIQHQYSQIYCSVECQEKYDRGHSTSRSSQRKLRGPSEPLKDYNERARSQGLSYGQLQGLERLGLR